MNNRLSLFILLMFSCFTVTLMAEKEKKYLEHQLPASWSVSDSIFEQTIPVEDDWWKKFNDVTLDSLMSIAVKNNYDVLMAMNRIESAKATLRQALGAYSPSFELSLGWTGEQSSGHISSAPQAVEKYASGTVSMNWGIDVFGSIRNKVRAERAAYRYSEAEYNATMVSLCAQLATAYFNLRAVQQQLLVTEKNCASQEQVVGVTRKKFEAGLVSSLDVAQALSSYYSSKSTIPTLQASIIQYENALSVLLGLYPDELRAMVSTYKALPEFMEPVGIGIPANLLMRRPDIRASEYQVAEQAGMLGVARSDWWPKIYLNGSVGFASKDMNKFFNKQSFTYEIAPTLTWTFFDGLQSIEAAREAKAQLDELINEFNYNVLNAVQAVDNALNSYKNSIKMIVALREVVVQNEKTWRLSID